MTGEKQERGSLINELGAKVEQLQDKLIKQEKDNKVSGQNGQKRLAELIYQEATLKKNIEKEEEDLKVVKLDVRKTSEVL